MGFLLTKRLVPAINLLVDGAEHVVIIATRKIAKGEQILFDYGPEYLTDT
jgi:hypothetical protein